jgi:hypothetical protein
MTEAGTVAVVGPDWSALREPDRRLAAKVAIAAGVGVIPVFASAMFISGYAEAGVAMFTGSSLAAVGTVTVVLSLLLLVFLVGLAHAFTSARGVAFTLSVVTATLTATVSMVMTSLMLTGYFPGGGAYGSAELDPKFAYWLSDLGNWWFRPPYAPLVGATLLSLAWILHHSDLPSARGFSATYAVVGVLGFLMVGVQEGPYAAFAIPVLVIATMVWLTAGLRASRALKPTAVPTATPA